MGCLGSGPRASNLTRGCTPNSPGFLLLLQTPAKLFSSYCQNLRGQEQQEDPRAGKGRPLCQAAGPGANVEVTYFIMLPMPSLMFTPPMCGPNLTPTSRPSCRRSRRSIQPSTSMALKLPPILPAPIGGGIRRGCTEDKQAVSCDVTRLPVSTNRSSPQTSLATPKAVDQ